MIMAGITLVGLLLILALRLIPFNFEAISQSPGTLLNQFTWRPLTFQDVPINILLFIPFSFGLTGLLRQRGSSFARSGALVVAVAAALTVGLEFLQLIMPERVSSVADIVANLLGALAGIAFYRMWEYGIRRSIVDYATPARIALVAGAYIGLVGVFTLYLNNSVRLTNWDSSYPLALGRELSGERPWRGSLEQLFFLDRALTEAEVAAAFDGQLPADTVAIYTLAGQPPYPDSQGSLPPLERWGEQPEDGTLVGREWWLQTVESLAAWSEPVSEASALTVGATILPERPRQRGPARIVTISADTSQRNLTLGQQAEDLTVRLRTPSNGENGQRPEMVVPGILGDGEAHQVIVTYDAPLLSVYIDKQSGREAVSLAPGLALFRDFARQNRWLVPMPDSPNYFNILYWSLFAAPALLILLVVVLIRWWGRRQSAA